MPYFEKRDMELLDLYDNDLRPTGQTVERGKMIPQGLMIPIVAVFIHNNEGKYLIQKVSESKGGYYATTAGHVKAGEMDFTISMQRELKEELGLSVTQSELKLLRIRRYGYKFTLLYMLRSNVPVEMLRLQKEEVESVHWMTREEIEKLCDEGKFNKIHYQLMLDCEERLTSLHLKDKR